MVALLDETRTWHDAYDGTAADGLPTGPPAARQLNSLWGLTPTNGVNRWFASSGANVARPSEPTTTGAGELPESQSIVGSQVGVDGLIASHCSMNTC